MGLKDFALALVVVHKGMLSKLRCQQYDIIVEITPADKHSEPSGCGQKKKSVSFLSAEPENFR